MYFFRGAGWLGAVYVFLSLRGWAVVGFFALGEKGSHFASFNKGFGSKTGLLEAHIMAGWGRGCIFIWRRPAGGRVQ